MEKGLCLPFLLVCHIYTSKAPTSDPCKVPIIPIPHSEPTYKHTRERGFLTNVHMVQLLLNVYGLQKVTTLQLSSL